MVTPEHDHERAVTMFGECPTCALAEHAAARSTDPLTSHAAARSLDVTQLRASQRAVLDLFSARSDLTLEELVDAAHAASVRFSDSRVRSAAAELLDVGLLFDTGRHRATRSGRDARVLALVRSLVS